MAISGRVRLLQWEQNIRIPHQNSSGRHTKKNKLKNCGARSLLTVGGKYAKRIGWARFLAILVGVKPNILCTCILIIVYKICFSAANTREALVACIQGVM
jgi:hypothetical protein